MAVRRGLTRFARPAGSLFAVLSVCPTGCASSRTPVRASHPRQAVQYAKKKPVLAYELFLKYGGEAGIDSLRSPCGQPVRCAHSLSNWLRRYSAHPWASPLRGQRRRCSKLLLAILCRTRSGLLIPARLCNIRKKSPYLRTSSS